MNNNALPEKYDISQVANDDWPVLAEINKGRFNISKKKRTTDIESLTQKLQDISVNDDNILQKEAEEDENASNVNSNNTSKNRKFKVRHAKKASRRENAHINNATYKSFNNLNKNELDLTKDNTSQVSLEKTSTVMQSSVVVEQSIAKEDQNTANENLSHVDRLDSNMDKVKDTALHIDIKDLSNKEIPDVEYSEQTNSTVKETDTTVMPTVNLEKVKEDVTHVTSVNPQQNRTVASSTPTDKSQHFSLKGLLKFAALGFAHLYVKKTTSLLRPLGFVAENIEKFALGFMHLVIPLLMTWLITTKVDFFASQLSQKSPAVVLVCDVAFYIACIFLWVSAQVIASGIVNVVKKTLRDVAKIGQENK